MEKKIDFTEELTARIAAVFKAVPASLLRGEAGMKSVTDCARAGFVVVGAGGPAAVPEPLFAVLDREFGVDVSGFNATFHKSFGTVADMDPEEYFIHQFMHYLTTYGAEAAGVRVPTYVPVEELRLPEGMLPADRLTVLQALPEEELLDRMERFARTTQAPNEGQKEAFLQFLPYVTAPEEDMASFEFRAMACAQRGTVPEDPVSLLRYLIYRTTGGTLVIKSQRLTDAVRLAAKDADDTARKILAQGDERALASIFLRYKPIFLAYKGYPGCGPLINRFRRLAVKYHKPLSDEAFQNLIRLALEGRDRAVDRLLEKASNRDLVKLINAAMLRGPRRRRSTGAWRR